MVSHLNTQKSSSMEILQSVVPLRSCSLLQGSCHWLILLHLHATFWITHMLIPTSRNQRTAVTKNVYSALNNTMCLSCHMEERVFWIFDGREEDFFFPPAMLATLVKSADSITKSVPYSETLSFKLKVPGENLSFKMYAIFKLNWWTKNIYHNKKFTTNCVSTALSCHQIQSGNIHSYLQEVLVCWRTTWLKQTLQFLVMSSGVSWVLKVISASTRDIHFCCFILIYEHVHV